MDPRQSRYVAVLSNVASGDADQPPPSAAAAFDDRVVVPMPGPTTGFHDLDDCLETALERGPRTLVLDMTSIEHVSSAMVAALLWTRRRCALRGVDVQLRNPSRRCLRALDRVGLLSAVPVEPPREPGVLEPAASTAGPGDSSPEPTPGITRFDLACQPEVAGDAVTLIRGWAEDRVLSVTARERLAAVARAGTAHGLSFAPRFVTVRLCWLDADRVRLDLRWRGCSDTATTRGGDLDATIATLDASALSWGFVDRGTGWLLWTIVDTR